MSLLCDNNNYTKKKIISSMCITIMKDGIFRTSCFKTWIKFRYFSTFHIFCMSQFCLFYSLCFIRWYYLRVKHIILSIRIVQCLLYDDDYTDHYYFSYQCLYFRDLIKNESLHLTISVVSSKLFPLDKGFYLLLHFYAKLHQ